MASAKGKKRHGKHNRNENLLLKLMKSLVNVKDRDNELTVLTNLHVMDILRREFNVNLKKKSELEVEIYINIMKHFLGSWPQWVELENIAQSDVNINNVLYTKCRSLKEYLADAIKTAEKEMGPILADYNKEQESDEECEQEIGKELVMEVACSMSQLNHLIFRQPHPQLNNTIFNIVESASLPSTPLQQIYFRHIVNWPHLQVKLFLPGFECQRWNNNHIERSIINLKREENVKRLDNKYPLNINDMYYRKNSNNRIQKKENIHCYLDELSAYVVEKKIMRNLPMEMLLYLVQQLRKDFENMDTNVQFGEYKFYLNNFKYVRYSSEEVPETLRKGESVNFADKFDLRLEEILTPCGMFKFTKLKLNEDVASTKPENKSKFAIDENFFNKSTWLMMVCTLCGLTFNVSSDSSKLETHIMDCHRTSLEWKCSGCHKSFSVLYLTENRWYHDCEANNSE